MERRRQPGLLASFQDLYADLLRLLTWRTGNPDQAAELVQEAYFRIAAVEESGQQVQDHRGYILRVANNLAIDGLRRESRRRVRRAPAEEALETPDPAPSADERLIARQRLERLDAALRELPPKARAALLMNRVEGLTQREIAVRLGVSESMVVKYIAQALRHCRARRDEAEP